MIITERKMGEGVELGDVRITLLGFNGTRIRIGIEAKGETRKAKLVRIPAKASQGVRQVREGS